MPRSLPFGRTSLLSLATICAALALFATGATFAVWTNSDSASGTVTASTVTIDVFGSPGTGLSFVGAGCPTALQPGTSCTETVNVKNISTGPITLTSPATGTIAPTDTLDPPGCTNAATNWSLSPLDIGTTTLDPNQTTTFDVTVTLGASAHDGCQGETATVTITVNAS